jgi:hypothetical protein
VKVVHRWDALNERQLALLRRIEAGENLSGPEHGGIRTSANALSDRGLVTLSPRAGGRAGGRR